MSVWLRARLFSIQCIMSSVYLNLPSVAYGNSIPLSSLIHLTPELKRSFGMITAQLTSCARLILAFSPCCSHCKDLLMQLSGSDCCRLIKKDIIANIAASRDSMVHSHSSNLHRSPYFGQRGLACHDISYALLLSQSRLLASCNHIMTAFLRLHSAESAIMCGFHHNMWYFIVQPLGVQSMLPAILLTALTGNLCCQSFLRRKGMHHL